MPRYQLSILAEDLPRGTFRRPNPYAKVVVSGGPREGETVGQTETLESTQDADFLKTIFLETDASIFMPLKVTIYNGRDESVLTEGIFEATEVNASPGHTQEQKDPANGARIVVSMEDSLRGQATGYVTLHFRGLDMKNIEAGIMGLGRSDPFFEIARKNIDHAAGVVRWNSIYRSKQIQNHLNPMWEEFTLTLEEICFGDLDWPIKIIVYDYQRSGKHRPIGQLETTLHTLSERVAFRGNADRQAAFEIFLDNDKGDNKTCGLIVVLKCAIRLES